MSCPESSTRANMSVSSPVRVEVPGPSRTIEAAERDQQAPPERHVRAHPDDARR